MALTLIASCAAEPPVPDPAPVPPPPPVVEPPAVAKPVPRPAAALRAARAERSVQAAEIAQQAAQTPAASAMRQYMEGIQEVLLARGLLRQDAARAESLALDAATLARNFTDIALHDEYVRRGDRLVPDPQPSKLRRWVRPVRISVEFGPSVAPATRVRDRAEIQDFAERLAQITGHDILATPSGGNFTVLVLNEDERRQIGPRLSALVPGIPQDDIGAIRALAPQNYCTVFAYSLGDRPEYVSAVAVIRAELPARLRSSCIHEELAQGLGLANDSPRARPSIFNDDEEFALLTVHDEMLLEMLYDTRLRPGMTPEDAAPLLEGIAAERLSARSD